jgi:hypothetical protein
VISSTARAKKPCALRASISKMSPPNVRPTLYRLQHALLLWKILRNFVCDPNVTLDVVSGVIFLFEERFLASIT